MNLVCDKSLNFVEQSQMSTIPVNPLTYISEIFEFDDGVFELIDLLDRSFRDGMTHI